MADLWTVSMRIPAEPASGPSDGVDLAFSHPAFISLKAQGAGFVLAAGDPPRVVWANRAAVLAFGSQRDDDLTARLFGGSGPQSHRLRILATEGQIGGAPRLERLRFVRGLTNEVLTALWVRLPGQDGVPLFGLAVLGSAGPASAGGDPATAWRQGPDVESTTPPAVPLAPPLLPAVPAENLAPAAAPSAEALRAKALATFDSAETIRFRWRTDASNNLDQIDRAAFTAIGADVPALGSSLIDGVAAFDPDAANRLRQVLATRGSWSGVDLRWPAEGGAARAPVVLGGAPIFESGRRFGGFRGFGVIHPGRMTVVAPASAAPASAVGVPRRPIDARSIEPLPEASPESLSGATSDVPPDAVTDLHPAASEAEAPDPAVNLAARQPPAGPVEGRDETGVVATAIVPPPDLLPTPFFGVPAADHAPPSAAMRPPVVAGNHADGAGPRVDARLIEAESIAEPRLAQTEILNPLVGPGSAANVVRFRPVQGNVFARFSPGADTSADRRATPPAPDAAADAETLAAANVAAEPEAFTGTLSPSERIAFAEIARTLGAPAALAPGVFIPGEIVAAGLRAPASAAAECPEDRQPAAASPILGAPAASADSVEALLASHAPALVDAAPVALLVCRGAVPLLANRALLALLGYASFADLVGSKHPLFSEPPDNPSPDAASTDPRLVGLHGRDGALVALTGRRQPIEWAGDGAMLWALAAGAAVPGGAANAAGKIEAGLKPAHGPGHHDLGALLDVAGDALAILDEAGRVVLMNKNGATWFGADRQGPPGESFTLLLAPESQAPAAALFAEMHGRAAFFDTAPAIREVVARTTDGATLPMRLTLGRLGPASFYAVLRDLSDQKRVERDVVRAEREAERASSRQPEFLAKVSHEIRTPLNAILGFAEVMMDERFGPLGNARYKDYLKDIHVSGTQVMSLVNDLLDLSRIEAGRLDLDLDAIDINKIIVDCVATMQPQAHRERVIMRTSLSARLPQALADDRTARQIVLNLLSNAVKFNEPGGQVIVSTALNDAHGIAVRIRDTGIGMSDSDIAAALEPFRQLASSKTVSGTGLGLPLTKALIGANGATLSIRSRPKEGTLVEVIFAPAAAVPARVPA